MRRFRWLVGWLALGLGCPAWTVPAQEPEWIWHGETGGTVYLRKTFRTPPYLWNSQLTVAADDEAVVYLNGVEAGACERWDRPMRAEVTVRLNQGENTIAIRAANRSGGAGVLVHLRLGGEATVVSDGSWLASRNEEPGWNTRLFNAARWARVSSLGGHGIEPWGDVLRQAAATPAEKLKVPEGFEAELLRSAEAGEGSWICLAFDPRGRLVVSPQGESQPLLRITMDGGRVERVEPVAAPLRYAMGLLWADGVLFANAIGPKGSGLYRCEDKNGNDQFEEEEIRLLARYEGGGEHGYHAVRLGPDGKLYILNGNGTRLPRQVAAHSAHRNYGQDMLALGEASNAMAQPAGYILRGDPDGGEWDLWMGGLRNAYDFDFNQDGELFAFDSDMEWDWGAPWYRPTRIVHCVSGAEFGWREERRVWPEEYEDSLPAVVNVGIGSPTGVEFGMASAFPENYRRALFAMDWSYGRIMAVHLEATGASYRGVAEPFLEGTPLNLTDLAFGPDGALYFVTGGRGIQSGLYRVRYVGKQRAAVRAQPAGPEANAGPRELRRQLERFHGRVSAEAVDFVWAHLGSSDRFIRYAARAGLESQPVQAWESRALNETKPVTALTALLALARVSSAESQPALLRALGKFPLDTLDEQTRLLKYRVIQLSFIRQGRPGSEGVRLAQERLGRRYPAAAWAENRELVRLLAWLEAPGIVPKTLDLLERAVTQEEQLHYIEQLRHVRAGWSMEDRKRYFGWWTRSRADAGHPQALLQWFADVNRRYVDGAWMDRFLTLFRRDALETLSGQEKAELAALTGAPLRQARLVPSDRAFVQQWSMEDLLPLLNDARGRNIERGRRALVDAQCLACHRFGNDGGATGPELTAMKSKYDRRSLLESILEPSKVINEQYQSMTVLLKEGDSVTGRLVEETPAKAVIETNPFGGGLEEIARERIEVIRPSELSMMPEGLVDVLTRDEILDLLAYLETGGEGGEQE